MINFTKSFPSMRSKGIRLIIFKFRGDTIMKKLLIFIVILSVWFLFPHNAKAEDTLTNVGYGFGSVLSSCLYSPAKLVYALTGTLTGGIAYGLTLGDEDVATTIWTPSLRGTYVITPDMLKGKEKIQFVGTAEEKKKNPTPQTQTPKTPTQENPIQEGVLDK
jgi:hypothetical protein